MTRNPLFLKQKEKWQYQARINGGLYLGKGEIIFPLLLRVNKYVHPRNLLYC